MIFRVATGAWDQVKGCTEAPGRRQGGTKNGRTGTATRRQVGRCQERHATVCTPPGRPAARSVEMVQLAEACHVAPLAPRRLLRRQARARSGARDAPQYRQDGAREAHLAAAQDGVTRDAPSPSYRVAVAARERATRGLPGPHGGSLY